MVKAAVKARLKKIGAYQHWPVQMGLGERCLDCHGCFRGLYFAVETKAPGEKPTKLQALTVERIRAAGGFAFVIDSVEQANELFANYFEDD